MHVDRAGMPTRIGDYQLVRSLPAAAPGILELAATHVVLPRRARLRVAEHAGDDAATAALLHEARVLETLRGPGVPRIYECGALPDRRPWIAIEALDGPTLADTIPLPPSETLAVLRDLAEILHHVHGHGVVHRRLCRELIVRHEGGLCVAGWGGAQRVRDADVDPRDDMHALGTIAIALLAAPPPRALGRLLERMTAPALLARPSAAEVRADALRVLEQLADAVEEVELELVEDLDDTPRHAGGLS